MTENGGYAFCTPLTKTANAVYHCFVAMAWPAAPFCFLNHRKGICHIQVGAA